MIRFFRVVGFRGWQGPRQVRPPGRRRLLRLLGLLRRVCRGVGRRRKPKGRRPLGRRCCGGFRSGCRAGFRAGRALCRRASHFRASGRPVLCGRRALRCRVSGRPVLCGRRALRCRVSGRPAPSEAGVFMVSGPSVVAFPDPSAAAFPSSSAAAFPGTSAAALSGSSAAGSAPRPNIRSAEAVVRRATSSGGGDGGGGGRMVTALSTSRTPKLPRKWLATVPMY